MMTKTPFRLNALLLVACLIADVARPALAFGVAAPAARHSASPILLFHEQAVVSQLVNVLREILPSHPGLTPRRWAIAAVASEVPAARIIPNTFPPAQDSLSVQRHLPLQLSAMVFAYLAALISMKLRIERESARYFNVPIPEMREHASAHARHVFRLVNKRTTALQLLGVTGATIAGWNGALVLATLLLGGPGDSTFALARWLTPLGVALYGTVQAWWMKRAIARILTKEFPLLKDPRPAARTERTVPGTIKQLSLDPESLTGQEVDSSHIRLLQSYLWFLDKSERAKGVGVTSQVLLNSGPLLNVGLESSDWSDSPRAINLTSYLRRNGLDVTGLDLNAPAGEGYVRGDIQNMHDFADNQFGAVISIGLLDPNYVFSLKDRGIVVFDDFYRKSASELHRILPHHGILAVDMIHPNPSVVEVFEQAGFIAIPLREDTPFRGVYLFINQKPAAEPEKNDPPVTMGMGFGQLFEPALWRTLGQRISRAWDRLNQVWNNPKDHIRFPKQTASPVEVERLLEHLRAAFPDKQSANPPDLSSEDALTPEERERLTPAFPDAVSFFGDYENWRRQNPDARLFVLLRHAETRSNIFQAIQDYASFSPLSIRGVRQARAFTRFMRHVPVPFDRYVAPDIERPYETLKQAAQEAGADIEVMRRFREVRIQPLGGISWTQGSRLFPGYLERFIVDPHEFSIGPLYAGQRVRRYGRIFRDEVARGEAQNVMAASSGMTILVLLMDFLHIPSRKYRAMFDVLKNPPNASFTILSFDPRRDGWSLLAYGDNSYLPESLRGRTTSPIERILNHVRFDAMAVTRALLRALNVKPTHPYSDYYPNWRLFFPVRDERAMSQVYQDAESTEQRSPYKPHVREQRTRELTPRVQTLLSLNPQLTPRQIADVLVQSGYFTHPVEVHRVMTKPAAGDVPPVPSETSEVIQATNIRADIGHEIYQPIMFVFGISVVVRDQLKGTGKEFIVTGLDELNIELKQRFDRPVNSLEDIRIWLEGLSEVLSGYHYNRFEQSLAQWIPMSPQEVASKHSLENCRNSLQFLLKRVRSMHKFVIQGHYRGSPRNVSLKESILLSDSRDIALHITTAEETAVRVDPDHIAGVWENLARNAFKAGAQNMWVSFTRDTNGIMVKISDDGHGIDPTDLPHIFEKGYSKHSTGLGLALCRDIVRDAGGSIEALSESGSGATFFIHLPAAEPNNGFQVNSTVLAGLAAIGLHRLVSDPDLLPTVLRWIPQRPGGLAWLALASTFVLGMARGSQRQKSLGQWKQEVRRRVNHTRATWRGQDRKQVDQREKLKWQTRIGRSYLKPDTDRHTSPATDPRLRTAA